MSIHYAILDEQPERINRIRFLLHLRGILALLAIDAAEVINWRSACREAEAEMCGVILYCDPANIRHLQALEEAGFDLPIYAIRGEGCDSPVSDGLNIFIGSIDEILQQLPAETTAATMPAGR
ncbi:MAG: hypothetical protein C0624_07005 [Desulfuromonas sp.]|nr:MAG: hypothetical protein C0624_07005 [Desulfuromonas sp.]